jgi:hypothetical protein
VPRILTAAALAILLGGCEPLALSLVGAGASTVLRHNFVDGVTYRTFTAPPAMVMGASLVALDRMGIAVKSHERYDGGDVLQAASDNRAIEIELEAVSGNATRVRIAARTGGPFYDTATANEIIAQTQRVLESAANYRDYSPGLSRI